MVNLGEANCGHVRFGPMMNFGSSKIALDPLRNASLSCAARTATLGSAIGWRKSKRTWACGSIFHRRWIETVARQFDFLAIGIKDGIYETGTPGARWKILDDLG
jgi:hypothetical protein